MTARDIQAGLNRMLPLLAMAAQEAVDEIAEDIFTESTEVYCPVLTGYLKSTATNTASGTGTMYTRRIKYSASYADTVHERPNEHSNPATASWKYLEIPFNKHAPNLQKRVGEKVGWL